MERRDIHTGLKTTHDERMDRIFTRCLKARDTMQDQAPIWLQPLIDRLVARDNSCEGSFNCTCGCGWPSLEEGEDTVLYYETEGMAHVRSILVGGIDSSITDADVDIFKVCLTALEAHGFKLTRTQ